MGAPAAFLSNSVTENKSGKIKDLERHYNISGHHYSEPGYQIKTGWKIKFKTLRIWLIISWILPAPLLGAG